jgi:DNA-binding NarL/FixJ family response regulator
MNGERYPKIAAFPELAPWERHLALMLVEDADRGTISGLFGITRGTVSTATCKILKKLNVTGLAGLTRLAIRRRYIRP